MKTSGFFGPLEQEVMACLWESKQRTVREVYEKLRQKRKIAYTTIMTVMTRLVEKGYLARKKAGRVYLYSLKKTKKQSARELAAQLLNSLLAQFGEEGIVAFVDEIGEISDQKREKLITILLERDDEDRA